MKDRGIIIMSVGSNNRLIRERFCTGCGVCAAFPSSPFEVSLGDKGTIQAHVHLQKDLDLDESVFSAVCPFSETAADENEIAKEYLLHCEHESSLLGCYRSLYVGHVCDGDSRSLASSGGMGRWLLHELLAQNRVDRVVHVVRGDPSAGESLYRYALIDDPAEVLCGAKSAYYPVTLDEALREIRKTPGRYAVTGIPCFIKALRLLSKQDPVFRDKIKFALGLICGHLKSARYADMLGWQLGIHPNDLSSLDFRQKIPGRKANEKGIFAMARDGRTRGPEVVQKIFGANYNLGFFQYNACNYCDDVVAETADVSIGDAWLPRYMQDGAGTSVVIIRNQEIEEVIRNGIRANKLDLQTISEEEMIESQAGGFRQRREGLAYRLYLDQKEGRWFPRKRVSPRANHIGRKRRKIYENRLRMNDMSHSAFEMAREQNDLGVFVSAMKPLIQENDRLNRKPQVIRIFRRVMNRLKRIGMTS